MQALSEQLRKELLAAGASLVGFADISELPSEQTMGYPFGISIAAALDPAVINEIGNGPTKRYYDEYCRLNKLLDVLDIKASEIIKEAGFNAFPKTSENVSIDYRHRSTILPHKTVATRAGLGWIGKCALLVTEEFGSAIRISSVLTDAPLEVYSPTNESRCGTCNHCVRNCPANALNGDLWFAGKERESFFNAFACRKKALERTWKVSPGETHCGLCILVCPRTKKYVESSGIDYDFPSVDMAANSDLEEILQLQKLVYQENAIRCNDFYIPPLTQTLEELKKEAEGSIILKIVEDRMIVGSVRAFEKDGNCYIGRLIVHPDYQNKGLGKKLMKAIEKCFRGTRYELFTGNLDEKNITFYEKLGYQRFREEKLHDGLRFIYLEKL